LSILTVSYHYQRALIRAAHEAQLIEFNHTTWQQRFSNIRDKVSLDEQNQIWQTLTRAPHSHQLISVLANSIEPAELGELGYALASCSELMQAIEILHRYQHVIGDSALLHLSRIRSNSGEDLQLDYFPQYEIARSFRVQAALICIIAIAKRLTGQRLDSVTVGMRTLPNAVIQGYFQTLTGTLPVSASTDYVRFSQRDLTLPLVTANPRLLTVLLATLNQQQQQLHEHSTAHFVQHALHQQPQLSRARIAQELGFTERTLVRKLANEGHRFKALKVEALKAKAHILLTHHTYSLEQIAERLGYSDASAFIKAYRLWYGVTPRSTR
jgi:AraC-like DNA-binding protein